MNTGLLLLVTAVASYLVGAIPFGWLVSRLRGVDILKQGSGNIGATNVARVVGLPWGILVFLLDFSKGALPVLVTQLLDPVTENQLPPDFLKVLAGITAFLGHLFPIYLGFRGGKGVATGAGVIAVLVPILTIIVLASWGLVLALTRYVSIASLFASALLFVLRLIFTDHPWGEQHLVTTLFCLFGALLVFIRHRANIRRLLNGSEHRLGSHPPP